MIMIQVPNKDKKIKGKYRTLLRFDRSAEILTRIYIKCSIFQRFKVIFDYLSVDLVLKQASILEEVTTRSCVGIKVHVWSLAKPC